MVLWTNSPLCKANSTWKTQEPDTSVLNSPEFNDKKNSIQPAGAGNTKKCNATKPFVLPGVNYTAWQALLWPTCTKGTVSLSCPAELIPPAVTQQSPKCQQSGMQEYLWWGQWCTEHAEGTSTSFIAVDQPFWHQYCSCLVFEKYFCRLSASDFKAFIALVKGVLFQPNLLRIYNSCWPVLLNFH